MKNILILLLVRNKLNRNLGSAINFFDKFWKIIHPHMVLDGPHMQLSHTRIKVSFSQESLARKTCRVSKPRLTYKLRWPNQINKANVNSRRIVISLPEQLKLVKRKIVKQSLWPIYTSKETSQGKLPRKIAKEKFSRVYAALSV